MELETNTLQGIATTVGSYALFSALAMAAIQWLKSKYQETQILLLLGGVSIVGAVLYAVLLGTGYWEIVWKHFTLIALTANGIYTVIDQIVKWKSGGTTSLSREDMA